MSVRKFIYFPSLSAGNIARALQSNMIFRNGLPARFYSDDFPSDYRHKYFLITAGHYYKKPTIIDEFGFDDKSHVMGDSGGYQIASGAIKWKPELRKQILTWLERNSTIAMNLDIPPRGKFRNKFLESLELSNENFKYFKDNRNRDLNVDFLNVIQGYDLETYDTWYQKVKDYEFEGWSVGGAPTLFPFMASITVLMQGKEQYNDGNKWLHILGTTKVTDFLLLSQLQKSLNDINSPLQVTTDSSTPSRHVVFGYYDYHVDWKRRSFRQLHIPKNRKDNNMNKAQHSVNQMSENFTLPKFCDFDNILEGAYNREDLLQWTDYGSCAMVLHNFGLFKESMDKANDIVNYDPYIAEQILGSDFFEMLLIMDEIVKAYENGTTPFKVFNKYKYTIEKFSSSNKQIVHSQNKFFS